MATILISPELRLRPADDRNWVLERRHLPDPEGRGAHSIRHAGRERWVSIGYHGSIAMALRQALEVDLRLKPGEYDLADLVRLIDQAVDRIVKALTTATVEESVEQDGEVSRLAG